jgi:hypothetical protein
VQTLAFEVAEFNSGAAAISKLLSDHGRMTGNPDRTQLGEFADQAIPGLP